jgi:hypothetical protein
MKKLLMVASIMLVAASASYGQVTSVPTTTLNLTVGSEAAIVVGTTTGFSTSTTFAPYTTSTPFTYYIRTGKTAGTGSITVQFDSDWSGSGGPSISAPPSGGDALSYVNTVQSPGTASSTGSIASVGTAYNVASFGANATSAISGNAANSVAWSLTNDPKYAQGSYSITATFTISAS